MESSKDFSQVTERSVKVHWSQWRGIWQEEQKFFTVHIFPSLIECDVIGLEPFGISLAAERTVSYCIRVMYSPVYHCLPFLLGFVNRNWIPNACVLKMISTLEQAPIYS